MPCESSPVLGINSQMQRDKWISGTLKKEATHRNAAGQQTKGLRKILRAARQNVYICGRNSLIANVWAAIVGVIILSKVPLHVDDVDVNIYQLRIICPVKINSNTGTSLILVIGCFPSWIHYRYKSEHCFFFFYELEPWIFPVPPPSARMTSRHYSSWTLLDFKPWIGRTQGKSQIPTEFFFFDSPIGFWASCSLLVTSGSQDRSGNGSGKNQHEGLRMFSVDWHFVRFLFCPNHRDSPLPTWKTN